MSTGKKIVLYNSITGFLYQFVVLALQFIERKVFLAFLGAEVLGINSSLQAIVAVASLAEGGMGAAIVYHLYKPLEEQDYKGASILLGIYKSVYNAISIGILVVSVCFLPFLHLFLKGVELNITIYLYFLLIALNTSASYMLSYKRCIFIADRKDYICKFIDGVNCLIYTFLRISFLLIFKSFTLYLVLSIIQTINANVIIQYLCKKKYREIACAKFDKKIFFHLVPDIKDLFAGQLSSYLFNSSDNIIISSMVSTISVGLLAGYSMVTKSIKNLINSVFGSFGAIIGRIIASTVEGDTKRQDAFQMYCYAIFFITTIIIVPEYILLEDFVANIWGDEYCMSHLITPLLVAEQFITLVQDPCGVYIVANGEFKKCRNADAIAAISNILLSLLLCIFLGVEGVLFATIIARILQWLVKAYYVNISSLGTGFRGLANYWFNNLKKVLVTLMALFISYKIVSLIHIRVFLVRFVVQGFLSTFVTFAVIVLFTHTSLEYKLTKNFMLKMKGNGTE